MPLAETAYPVPVALSPEQIKNALHHDATFFIQFFLGDELTHPVPEFHPDIFYLMTWQEAPQVAIAIPRDHAKTTLAKLAAVWYFLFTDYRFIIYLSNTIDVAVPAVVDIIAFLETDNCRQVFGDIDWTNGTRQDGKGIYKFKLQGKTCMLRALGAGKQVRGINIDNRRPQLAIVDDLEDEENTGTEDAFRKLKRWFYGPFLKCLDKFHNKVVQIGNLVATSSLLQENLRSNYWYTRLYGCILQNGQPLWPDAWPLKKLQLDFLKYQEAGMADVWFAEMMNMPLAGGRGIIAAEEIYYLPAVTRENIEYGFITVDLAISKQTWAHKTCAAVHGWVQTDEGGCWQIVDERSWRGIDPIALFYELVQLCFEWGVTVIGLENVSFQASLQTVYPHLALSEGLVQLQFVPLQAIQRKTQRIVPWAGMIKARKYALTRGDFAITQQLLAYDPAKNENQDDDIDCCAHGVQMISRYMHLIAASMRPYATGTVQDNYQVAEV